MNNLNVIKYYMAVAEQELAKAVQSDDNKRSLELVLCLSLLKDMLIKEYETKGEYYGTYRQIA